MKSILSICMLAMIALFTSCEKDEGKLPNISFKTGGTYVSSDVTITKGTAFKMGINASKSEDEDVLKKFNISKTIDGAPSVSLYDQDLSGGDADNFSYDFTTNAESTTGAKTKYIFTVTNRDGLVNQISLTVTSN